MVSNFDHVTVVVTDVDAAKHFFGLLGFEQDKAVVISGPEMDEYLDIPGVVADHVTLVLADAHPRQETQLLHYRSPAVGVDDGSGDLLRTGFNHLCFKVPSVDDTITHLEAAGLSPRNQPMSFNNRRIVFFEGPSDVVVEFAEWI